MAPVMLPKPPRTTEPEVREMSFAKDMIPTTGGKTQRQDRLGTRHSFSFDIDSLKYGWCGAGLAADLAMGRTGEGAVIPIPEPNIPVVDYGLSPKVDGAPQIGSAIQGKDMTPGVVIKKGKWFNLIVGGRYYAYFTTADVTVGIDGRAVLPLYPMIRRSAANNSELRLKDPLVQGLIKDPVQRKIMRVGAIGLSFEIEEQE